MSPAPRQRVKVQTSDTVAGAKSAATKDEAQAKKASVTLDSFVNFSQKLGVGADNAMSSSTYGFNPITRQRVMLEWIHRGSWLGGVAIDVVADDMTRAGVEITSTAPPEDISKIEEAATSLGIWNSINDAIKWERLYGGSLAVMLVDGQDPEEPFRINTIKAGQFKGLAVLDRWMVEPSLNELVADYGPYMGLPKYYKVVAPGLGFPMGIRIHYTRCLRLEGIRLPYWQRLIENLWGVSVLERLYDRMIGFDSASTGAAQLVYKSYIRTYKIKDLRELVSMGGDALNGLVAYVDNMRRFQGIEGMTLIDADDEMESSTHGAFSGLSDILQQFGQQISGALQIPLVRLFGQSPSGFSSGEADLRMYYDGIKQQQEKVLRVMVTKIYRAIAASEGVDIEDGFKIDFRSLWQLSDKEKSDIANTVTDAVTKAHEAGLIKTKTAMQELKQSAQVTGVFSNIEDDDIEESELDEPPPGAGALEGQEEPPKPPVGENPDEKVE